MTKLKAIFPNEWKHIMSVYNSFVKSSGAGSASEKLLSNFVEIGVRFGERLAGLEPQGFVEIGCGLAIPSLTMARLGTEGGKAVDVDPNALSLVEDLAQRLECDLEVACRDVFENRPKLQKGQLLVAEKPASYKKNILEVEYNLSNWCKIEGHNFAIIPSYLEDDTLFSYAERCGRYEKRLRQVGFKVENRQVIAQLPYRWLIATKRGRGG